MQTFCQPSQEESINGDIQMHTAQRRAFPLTIAYGIFIFLQSAGSPTIDFMDQQHVK